MPIKCTIGGVDVSSALKGLSAQPGGDGLIGQGTFTLDQLSGGMDLRPYMEVRIWQTFDAAGNGVAAKGRLFGGIISVRATSNHGTTKTWSLRCSDFNLILHRVVRDAASTKSITLTAGHFNAQIQQLTTIIQQNGLGTVNTDIDNTGVADLYATMPAVTYEGGHAYGWYIQQLCNTAQSLNSALNPHFYMGVGTTFGVGDTFGNPVLYVFNGASLPAIGLSFSDVVAGGRKPYFNIFKRTTDATQTIQRKQAFFSTAHLIATSGNATSQSTYPNPFINHGGTSNTGYWMDEVSEDRNSTTFAAAQAELDRQIAVSSIPGDTFEFDTEERVLPGDMIGLGNALEGIADDTPYRVVKVTTTVLAAEVINSHLTVNSRRLGLFDNGQAVFAPPVEGDIAPLPPASFSLTSNVYNGTNAVMTWAIGASLSPNAIGYAIQGRVGHTQVNVDVGTDLAPVTIFPPGLTYDLQAFAYSGNILRRYSEGTPSVPLTGTTATIPAAPPAPSITSPITGGYNVHLGYFAAPIVSHPSGDHSHGGYIEWWQGGRTEHHLQAIPWDATYPYQPAVGGLDLGVVYSFSAFVFDQYNQQSASATTRTYTPRSLPVDKLPDAGWDHTAYDGTLADWLPISPSVVADFLIDASVASFNGKSSLQMIVPASTTKQIISPLIETYAGEQIVHAFAVKRGSGTGTAPTASAFVRYFAQDGTTQVGTDTLISAAFIPTTSFPTVPVEGKLTAPAGAFSFAYLFQGVGAFGATTYNLWWSFPKVKRTITNPAAVELWADPATPRTIRDNTGVIRGSESATPSNVVYKGINTGGSSPISVSILSSTGDSLFLAGSGADTLLSSSHGVTVQAPAGFPASLIGDGGSSSVVANLGAAVNITGSTGISGSLLVSAGLTLSGVSTKTATFTADANSTIYVCNSASAITANLPAASGLTGRIYIFININSGKVTIDGNGSEAIDGITTYPLQGGRNSVTIVCTGAGWYVMDQSGLILQSDGTRWLGPELVKPFTLRTPAGAGGLAPVVATLADAPVGQTRGVQLVRLDITSYVVTTNNGSNYWTYTLLLDDGTGTRTNVGSANTSAHAANNWKPISISSFSSNNFAAAAQVVYNVDTATTGAPGNIYPAFDLHFREIYT